MDSLDLHYAKSILLKTLENAAPCQVSDYLPIASNWRTLQDVIDALVKDGYLFKLEKIDQRKRYEVSLTLKGQRVAKLLQIIEQIPIFDVESWIVVLFIPEELTAAIIRVAGLLKGLKTNDKLQEDPSFLETELIKFSMSAIKEKVKKMEKRPTKTKKT